MSRAGGGGGGAKEGRRESPPHIHAGPRTSSHNLIPALPKSGLATTFFFFRPPHPKPRSVLTFREEVGAWSSPRAGRTAAGRGRRSARPSVRDGDPDEWERGGAGGGAGWGRPLLRSPLVLHRCPAEESRPSDGADCRGNGGDGRDGLEGRDRARTGRETARSGSGSSPCRGGLGAEAG